MEATRPNMFISKPSLDQQVNESEEPTDEEKRLAVLARNNNWKLFRKIADKAIAELDHVNKEAISSGASLEEIGRNTVVISMAQEIITKLFNRVDDAVESCETDEK